MSMETFLDPEQKMFASTNNLSIIGQIQTHPLVSLWQLLLRFELVVGPS
mgnify:CR=1 FL=1